MKKLFVDSCIYREVLFWNERISSVAFYSDLTFILLTLNLSPYTSSNSPLSQVWICEVSSSLEKAVIKNGTEIPNEN